jgi:hypothetical protein
MRFNLLKRGQPLHLWRLQVNTSSLLPKLFDIPNKLGERRAEGRIGIPTQAQELLYACIVEAWVVVVRSWSAVFIWMDVERLNYRLKGRGKTH